MKKTFAAFILGLLTSVISAQENAVRSYSLKEAVDFAIQNNYTIKNAKLGEAQAKARNWEILTTGMPTVTGNVDYNWNYKPPQIPAFNRIFEKFFPVDTSGSTGAPDVSFVLHHTLTANVQLSQLIFDARYLIGIRATKDLLQSSRLSTQMSEIDIKYAVTKAYYQAEAAQEAKSLLLDNLKLIDKLLGDTRKVYEQGLTEELDVNRLELVRATLESQINNQNKMADVALANLKYQMGLSLSDQIILRDKLNELKSSAGIALENKFDPSMRVEYQLLNNAVTLRGYDMKQKRSGYYPYLTGFVNFSANTQTDKFGEIFTKYTDPITGVKSSQWYPAGMLGLSLKIPIFDSGLKGAQVKQARLELQKTQNQLADFNNAAQLQFQVSQSSLSAAIEDESIATKTVDLSKKIFDKNTAKFKSGVGSSFELEQAEQDYAANQLKYVQSLMNLLNAKADLDKAMGVK